MSRIADLIKGLLSLAVIVALLVGIPALLLIIVGFPLPTEAPSWPLIRTHIEDGNIPDVFVVKTLAVVVWIVWIQLAVAVLTEVFGLLRGRASGRAPVLPGIQLFAGKLVASTVLIISALTPSRAATAAPIVPLDAAQLAAGDVLGAEPGLQIPTGHRLELPEPSQQVHPADPAEARETAGAQYTTKGGDNWWDIAERLLGDGMRWSELRELNSGKTMLTGDVISEQTETVSGGWRLDVPPDANPGLLSDGAQPEPAGQPVKADDADRAGEEIAAAAEVGAQGRAEERVEAAAVGAGTPDGSDPSGPLLRAIRPYTLVYEGPTGAADAGPGVPYQVVEGDNLWDIAERHLGDPFRWPEIFENSNQFDQTFGRRITDPNLIWPDSIVWLPSDAVDVPAADPALVAEVVGPLRPVDPAGDDGRTEIQPDDLAAASEAARETAGAHQLANGSSDPGGPDGSGPGSGPDGPKRSVEDTNLDQPDTGFAGEVGHALSQPPGMAFGAGGLLVASGLLGLLTRARRLRLSESGERSTPAPPPMDLVDIETVLRNSSDNRRAVSVHGAIGLLGNRSIVVGEPLAAPEVIRVSRDRIEVVQRGADPELPAPWLVGSNPALDFLADRSLAVLPAEFFPDELSDDDPTDTPAPTCVTVGGGLMVNLEAVGVLGIDGPPELSAGLIRSMVHELATGPARRSIDIRVSDWLPGAELHEHVRCGPLDDLTATLRPWVEDAELSLTAAGSFSAYAMRVAGEATLPNPTVIFADVADHTRIQPLVERAERHVLPLAVVFAGDLAELPSEPETVVRIDRDTLRLEPHGFTAAMQYLDVDLVLGAAALVRHARQAPMVLRADDHSALAGAVDHETDPSQAPTEETPEQEIPTELPAEEHEITDQAEDADTGMLIRVLGPVEFEGAPAGFSEQERSLLTFLALVGPSTARQLRDAVWPGNAIDDAGFAETIDHLRTVLGARFPLGGDDRYRLRSAVTDLGSARRWITQAGSMSEDRARNLLQLALADVRGRPFSDVGDRYWQWIADHKMALATQATSLLMDACFDLCDSAYQANDIHLAKWACEVGSLVDPLHETVVTRRAQLLQVIGSDDEAERVVEEWEARYQAAASRPAPRGPRMTLKNLQTASPHVG